jgi:hypothetical protein
MTIRSALGQVGTAGDDLALGASCGHFTDRPLGGSAR